MDRSRLLAALRAATVADPGYPVAAIDLAALEGRPAAVTSRPLTAWERHHLDVVIAAVTGDARRAADLLREHLVAVACDPIAVAVVLAFRPDEPLGDVLARTPGCHCARS